MATTDATIEEQFAPATEFLKQDPRVRAIWAFGSRAQGTARPDSDYDIAVLLDRELPIMDECRIAAAVSRAMKTPKVDLVFLKKAPPLLRREVVARGKRLHPADDREIDEIEMRWMMEYYDTQHLRRVQDRLFRELVP